MSEDCHESRNQMRGPLADRPATCTVGATYFAADVDKLYVCSAENTWTAQAADDGECPHCWLMKGHDGECWPEPVIVVAPGEPNEHCDYCFTVKPCVLEDSSGRMMCQDCLDKAAASTDAPAVPAQEAPRDAGICGKIGTVGYQQVRCTRLKGHDQLCAQLTPDGLYALDFVPTEPQAGAHVPASPSPSSDIPHTLSRSSKLH